MSFMESMMGSMMNRMSQEDKAAMMDKMMSKFFEGMSKEDKQQMMQDMMPKMMEGMTMMDMMSGMIGGTEQGGMMSGMMSNMAGGDCPGAQMPQMAQMMTRMMPHCLEAMLPQVPKEARIDFCLKLVKSMVDNGSTGMTEEEKKAFKQSLVDAIQKVETPV